MITVSDKYVCLQTSRCRRSWPSTTISLPPHVIANVEFALGTHWTHIMISFESGDFGDGEISPSTSIFIVLDLFPMRAHIYNIIASTLRSSGEHTSKHGSYHTLNRQRVRPEAIESEASWAFENGDSKGVARLRDDHSACAHQFRRQAPCNAQQTTV